MVVGYHHFRKPPFIAKPEPRGTYRGHVMLHLRVRIHSETKIALRFLESTQDGSLPLINGLITLPSVLTNG